MKSATVQAMGCQFLQENAVEDSNKGFVEVKGIMAFESTPVSYGVPPHQRQSLMDLSSEEKDPLFIFVNFMSAGVINCEMENLQQEGWVTDQLDRLNTHKSTFGERARKCCAELPSIVFEKLWRTVEVPNYWRKGNVTPVFKKGRKKDLGNYQQIGLTFIPGKVMEQIILEVINKHVEEKKVVRSSQHEFNKVKSCLTNLIAFYYDMAGLVDERRAVHVVYLEFSKAFDTVSHKVLLVKLRKCGLDEWTVKWIKNWLNGRTQRIVISGVESSWSL
ncbi:RNA-directed DNA polymerase from mobile element jockey-like protein [Pitangus sulphuratus]|nr:RNA-directed DNA polymerase from mobile element jockey-like protein [Pitangus sulphuratus]